MTPIPGRIHPTAVVSPEADLPPGTAVGPFAVVDGSVRLGPGCAVGARAHLIGPLVLGRGNVVGPGAVLGDAPQHVGYRGEPTRVEIGDGNVFGDRATVHRAAVAGGRTRVGSGNAFHPGSHVAHDCEVGDGCTLGARALLAGHVVLGDGAAVAAGCAVTQFCRLGRLSVVAAACTTKDVPPFVVQGGGVNAVTGINAGGMRAAGLDPAQVAAVGRAFRAVFREGRPLPEALALVQAEWGRVPAVREFVAFLRDAPRGVNRTRGPATPQAAAASGHFPPSNSRSRMGGLTGDPSGHR